VEELHFNIVTLSLEKMFAGSVKFNGVQEVKNSIVLKSQPVSSGDREDELFTCVENEDVGQGFVLNVETLLRDCWWGRENINGRLFFSC